MNNVSQLLYENKKNLLLLRSKELRMMNDLYTNQRKIKVLNYKLNSLKNNIKNLHQEERKYQTMKKIIGNEVENSDDIFSYIFFSFTIKIPFVNIFSLLLLFCYTIAYFYNNQMKNLDKKMSDITLQLKKYELEIFKLKRELITTSIAIKKLENQIKENQSYQVTYYMSTRYILSEYDSMQVKSKSRN